MMYVGMVSWRVVDVETGGKESLVALTMSRGKDVVVPWKMVMVE